MQYHTISKIDEACRMAMQLLSNCATRTPKKLIPISWIEIKSIGDWYTPENIEHRPDTFDFRDALSKLLELGLVEMPMTGWYRFVKW